MREITFRDAIREAMVEEMRRDPCVFLMGEDVGIFGGCFKVSQGMLEEFGQERVRDTAISESGIIGTALGAAMTGMRPIAEIMFGDFLTLGMDQLVNQVAKVRYMSGGNLKSPLVIRTTTGSWGRSTAAQHSQSFQGWISHIPGLFVIAPSTPYDAKGLLKSAIRCDNPVIFFEHKMIYNNTGPVPEDEYLLPIGKAEIKREGTDVTVVATLRTVEEALKAAEVLEAEDISLEVIDPRTIRPIDKETLISSMCKTGRAIVVDEGYPKFGFTGEIASILYEGAFDYVDAPIIRIAAPDTPIPFSHALELPSLPNKEKITDAARHLMHRATTST
jgi:pyruvate dehydrogenase E1 component beta subunit